MPAVEHLKGVRNAAEEQTNLRCAEIPADALSPRRRRS
jgi:hypothetical protein